MPQFKPGDTVFVNNGGTETNRAKVVEYIPYVPSCAMAVYKLHHFGTSDVFLASEECVFATLKDAQQFAETKQNERVKRYKEEIKSLNDLLSFPVKYFFDYSRTVQKEAKLAYIARAKELLGVDIDPNANED